MGNQLHAVYAVLESKVVWWLREFSPGYFDLEGFRGNATVYTCKDRALAAATEFQQCRQILRMNPVRMFVTTYPFSQV